ncbi:hypothetical protein HID58_091632 [Brassica napus]|uniref:Uncharacterized protein n=1 Tax=Brassica napus TaxID=3708 RepID=A0ABQ7WZJ1_BRANA|nr:hypothetical protein HID58_091632 [Brassica napus]
MNSFASTDALLFDCTDTTISIDVPYYPSIDTTFIDNANFLFFLVSDEQFRNKRTKQRTQVEKEHLVHSLWLEEGKLWRFRIRDEHRLLPLSDRRITDFGNSVEQLCCMPDEAFLRNPRNMSHRPPSIRRTRAQDAQAPPLPDFPNIPDIPMHDQGDFQKFVVDALEAIWARVSCQRKRATGAQAPAPAAACRDPSPEDDEATDEDTV